MAVWHTSAPGVSHRTCLWGIWILFPPTYNVPRKQKYFLPSKMKRTPHWHLITHGKNGYRTFRMYGCTGGSRFSHTLALLQTAGAISQAGGDIVVYEKNAYIFFLSNDQCTLPNRGGYLSVFAWGKAAQGVTLKQLNIRSQTQRLPLMYRWASAMRSLPHKRKFPCVTAHFCWYKQKKRRNPGGHEPTRRNFRFGRNVA